MSWPFVCSDFHSTGKQHSLETLRKTVLFSEKHIIQISSSGTHQLVVFLLYFGSALLIFSLVCLELWPCSWGTANYYWPLKAPVPLILFLKYILFALVWTHVKESQEAAMLSWHYFAIWSKSILWGFKTNDECEIVSEWKPNVWIIFLAVIIGVIRQVVVQCATGE